MVATEAASGTDRARAMIAALGGAANLRAVDACTTRLRLEVANQSAVDEAALRALGARGFVRPSADSLQVVLGPIADQVAGELRAVLRGGGTSTAAAVPSGGGLSAAAVVSPSDNALPSRLLEALGGDGNVAKLEGSATRILATLRDGALAREDDLRALGLRGIARPSPLSIHLLMGPEAAGVLQEMRRLIA